MRVVDGDTIRVAARRREERVRYIGVDTPETVKPGTPVQCFGKAASAFNARLVARADASGWCSTPSARDRYGRLLAYVYREPRRAVRQRRAGAPRLRPAADDPAERRATPREFRRLARHGPRAAGAGSGRACGAS